MKIKIFDKPRKQSYEEFESMLNDFMSNVEVISTTVNSNVAVAGSGSDATYDYQYVVTIFYKEGNKNEKCNSN